MLTDEEAETPVEAAAPPQPEKSDYESLLTVIATMWPTAKKINSARILESLGKLEAQVKEELKELVFQDYLKSKT